MDGICSEIALLHLVLIVLRKPCWTLIQRHSAKDLFDPDKFKKLRLVLYSLRCLERVTIIYIDWRRLVSALRLACTKGDLLGSEEISTITLLCQTGSRRSHHFGTQNAVLEPVEEPWPLSAIQHHSSRAKFGRQYRNDGKISGPLPMRSALAVGNHCDRRSLHLS